MIDVDPDVVSRAALSCPGVVRLAGGVGVFLDGPAVEVRVVVRDGRPLHDMAEEIRANVAPLASGVPVDVVIADIEPQHPPVGVVDVTAPATP